MHTSAGTIPASPVAGCSCFIPAIPTTTSLCAFLIAHKLMRICTGMATPGCRPDLPAGPQHLPLCTPCNRSSPLSLHHVFLAPAAGQSSNIGRIYIYATYVKHAKYALYAHTCSICTIYMQHIDNMQYMLNIKYMSDMQYMHDGCIFVNMAIQHTCIKYLGPF